MTISRTEPMFNVYIQGKLPSGKPCVFVGDTNKTAEEAIQIAKYARKMAGGNTVLALKENIPQKLILRMFNARTKTQAHEIVRLKDTIDVAMKARTSKMLSLLA